MTGTKATTARIAVAVALSAAVLMLSRIPSMYVSPICAFFGKLILAACAATVCDAVGVAGGLSYSVAIPLIAWLLDVIEGQMAVAYGLAAAVMTLILQYAKLNIWLKNVLAAVSAAGVLVVYSTALLSLRHEKTFLDALSYAFSRQLLPCVAIFAGAYLGSFGSVKRKGLSGDKRQQPKGN